MKKYSSFWVVVIGLALMTGVFAREGKTADHSDKNAHWVGTWASSPQLGDADNGPPAPGFADATLRQIVHVSRGGRQLRLRFSNAFGTTPLTLQSAHVAAALEGSRIRPESDRVLTFSGESSVSIPPGALMLSDPVEYELAPLSNVAVTIHVKGGPASVTVHPGSRTTSYLQAGDAVLAPEMPGAATVDHWYFINGIDVATDRPASAIAILGDSITDGRGSTTNGNDRWPDQFARRLQLDKKSAGIGVLNQGIGGNRLLRDGLGPNTLARLDRDVLAQTGVRWLIILEGINDIGTRVSRRDETAATGREIISAFEQIILRAHAHNIRVYGATILPYEGAPYFSPDGEADRQTINRWIRTSGKFDDVIDFDAVVRDPQNPSRLSAAADSGDHLHPGPAGYRLMAEAIDLKMFTP